MVETALNTETVVAGQQDAPAQPEKRAFWRVFV
jgi:hypothetical protein